MCFAAWLAIGCAASVQAQAIATVSCTSLDSGGSRLHAGNYTLDQSFAGNGELLTVGNDSLWAGYPAQLPNPPIVPPYTLDRGTNLTAKVLLSRLMSTVTDLDGDEVFFVSLADTSANGAAIGLLDGWVTYDPLPGFNSSDSFTWVVQSDEGDQTVGCVLVQVLPPVPLASLSIISVAQGPGSGVTLTFIGIPGLSNVIQYTDSLNPPVVWTTLGTYTAGANGVFQVVDPTGGNTSQRFYRNLVQ